jgi:hypothetical protein
VNFNQKRTIKAKPNNAIIAIDNCFKNTLVNKNLINVIAHSYFTKI